MSKRRRPTANKLRIVETGHGAEPATPGEHNRAPVAGAPPKGNLPLVLTSFVGREVEISEVESLLAETRLLTLTGPGGCGKTRLALRVAAGLGEPGGFGDGAWWIGLSSLSDPGLVPKAVASALGVREAPDRTLTEALAAFLEAREALLILDNCEHLVGACAALADALLRSCPRVKILATSREPLGVAGETSWPVPPLSLPAPGQEQDAEDLLRFGATRLFAERARTAYPGFTLTKENAPAGRDVREAGRDAARHRARGREDAGALARTDPGEARRPLPALEGRQSLRPPP